MQRQWERCCVVAAAVVTIIGVTDPRPIMGGEKAGGMSGWKVIKETGGKCQLSIPGDWSLAMPGVGLAQDPTQKASAAVQTDTLNSWSELKETAKQLLKPTAIQEDGPNRFAFTYTYGKPGAHYYVAKRFSGFNCVAQVDLNDAGSAEKYGSIAKQMIESLDKVP